MQVLLVEANIKSDALIAEHRFAKCWGTRIRTKNDRTRICSVTITPYPKSIKCAMRKSSNADAKIASLFWKAKVPSAFF